MHFMHVAINVHAGQVRSGQVRSGQVRSGNLISLGEPLARGYFVVPGKEKRIYKIKLKIKVELINIIMQKSL